MRTTITIDDALLAEVRGRAAAAGTTVSQVIEDSVRESMLRRDETPAARFRVRPFHGGRPRPTLDLDDNASLLRVMEDE